MVVEVHLFNSLTLINLEQCCFLRFILVMDHWDRRTMNNLVKKFCCPSIVDSEEYRFDENGIYYAPPDGDVSITLRLFFLY